MKVESRLKIALQNLLYFNNQRYSFYGIFLASLNKSLVEGEHFCKTACVAKGLNSDVVRLIFNKDFIEECCPDSEQLQYLIIHELEHIAREHIFGAYRVLMPDHTLANMAMDISINQTITQLAYDSNGDSSVTPLKPPMKDGKSLSLMPESFPNLNLESDKDSMYYYKKLREAKEKKQKSAEKGEASQAKGLPKDNKLGTSGDPNFDAHIDSDNLQNMDQHTWDEVSKGMSEMEKELVARKLREIMKNAAKEAGNCPAHLEEALDLETEIEQPSLPWEKVLRNFTSSFASPDLRLSRTKPNLRIEGAPIIRQQFKSKGVFLYDSSGSVSNEDLQKINSELYHVWKTGTLIDYAAWDMEVDEEGAVKYDGDLSIKRTKCGGTRMSCATEYINEKFREKRWSFAIIATDGYVESDITESNIPTIVLITNGGNIDLDIKHKIVEMKN